MRVAHLALVIVLLAWGAATAAWPVPGAPCPGPFGQRIVVGTGWAGSDIYVSLGCDGGPIKTCTPTWVGAIDLLFVC